MFYITSNSQVTSPTINLDTLAATVRAELTAVGKATSDLLAHGFAIGDALCAPPNRQGRNRPQSAPAPILNSASWKAASIEERMSFVDDIPLVEWLAAIPSSWRTEIIDRVDGLRAAHAKPVTAAVVH